jgi:hypothetical protein
MELAPQKRLLVERRRRRRAGSRRGSYPVDRVQR